MLKNMKTTLEDIKSRINNIQTEGITATNTCKELIGKKREEQKVVIKNIMESIGKMSNMDDLNNDINGVNKMIDNLLPPDSATSANNSNNNKRQKGGYTYGKSRRGKGKRRRRHKTHKKHTR